MTGINDNDDGQNCPNCSAAFGWDHDEGRFDRFDAENAEVYRNRHGELFFTIEFDCPSCGEPLLAEEASTHAFGTDPRPNR